MVSNGSVFARPRAVEIEMDCGAQFSSCARLEARFLRTREAKILRRIRIVRLHPQRFIELENRLRNLSLAQKNEAEIVVSRRSIWIGTKGCQIVAFRIFENRFSQKTHSPDRNARQRNPVCNSPPFQIP